MARLEKLLWKILSGHSDGNISFAELRWLPKMANRYEIIIYWSKKDRCYVTEVPELPGCMADGDSYQNAIANTEIVIAEWIETAQELGREIPEPKGRLMFA